MFMTGLGPNNEYVAVTIDIARHARKTHFAQVEDVADQIGGRRSRGVKVPRLYRSMAPTRTRKWGNSPIFTSAPQP